MSLIETKSTTYTPPEVAFPNELRLGAETFQFFRDQGYNQGVVDKLLNDVVLGRVLLEASDLSELLLDFAHDNLHDLKGSIGLGVLAEKRELIHTTNRLGEARNLYSSNFYELTLPVDEGGNDYVLQAGIINTSHVWGRVRKSSHVLGDCELSSEMIHTSIPLQTDTAVWGNISQELIREIRWLAGFRLYESMGNFDTPKVVYMSSNDTARVVA